MTFANENDYTDRAAVINEYPGATKVVKVEGGWAVFETMTEYETWRKQN